MMLKAPRMNLENKQYRLNRAFKYIKKVQYFWHSIVLRVEKLFSLLRIGETLLCAWLFYEFCSCYIVSSGSLFEIILNYDLLFIKAPKLNVYLILVLFNMYMTICYLLLLIYLSFVYWYSIPKLCNCLSVSNAKNSRYKLFEIYPYCFSS